MVTLFIENIDGDTLPQSN